MKNKLMTLAGLALAAGVLTLSPAIALANTPPSGHDHTETAHDRTPKVHDRGTVAHH